MLKPEAPGTVRAPNPCADVVRQAAREGRGLGRPWYPGLSEHPRATGRLVAGAPDGWLWSVDAAGTRVKKLSPLGALGWSAGRGMPAAHEWLRRCAFSPDEKWAAVPDWSAGTFTLTPVELTGAPQEGARPGLSRFWLDKSRR